jgi:hypothetical protein
MALCPNCSAVVNDARRCYTCGASLLAQPAKSAEELNNPFATPPASATARPVPAIDLDDENAKHIRNAWIAGIVSTAMTCVVWLIFSSEIKTDGVNFLWVDVLLMGGLTFGVYKKSRAAATVLFLYFVASKIMLWVDAGKPTGLALGIVFGILYFRGMVATYDYHRALSGSAR